MDHYEKIYEFLTNQDLHGSIDYCQAELKKIELTDFHWVLDKNMLHLENDLMSFLNSNFKGKPETTEVKSFYSELNGFSINWDEWSLNILAYDTSGNFNSEDLDWLCEEFWGSLNPEYFTIKGWEHLQKVFEDYYKTKKYEIEFQENAAVLTEFLVINRLQELFRTVVLKERTKKTDWAMVPFGITAHDYELILKI